MSECPKCLQTSGDDWSQCKGKCPIPFSPHYVGPLVYTEPDNSNFHIEKGILTLRKGLSEEEKEQAIAVLATWLFHSSEDMDYDNAHFDDAKLLAKSILKPESPTAQIDDLIDDLEMCLDSADTSSIILKTIQTLKQLKKELGYV